MASTDQDDAHRPLLPPKVRDHLGRQLRSVYNLDAGKPAYLGDPGRPAEFDPQLRRLEGRLKAQEAGTEAVAAALSEVTGGARREP